MATWSGNLHFYGRLYDGEGGLISQVERRLDTAGAKQLNREEEYPTYHPGDETSRFYSRDDLIDATVNLCRESVNGRSITLLDGLPGLCPRLVIFSDTEKQ